MSEKFYKGNYVLQYQKQRGDGEGIITETLIANPRADGAIMALVVVDDGHHVGIEFLPRDNMRTDIADRLSTGASTTLTGWSDETDGINALTWIQDCVQKKRLPTHVPIVWSTQVHVSAVNPANEEQLASLRQPGALTGNPALDQEITSLIHDVSLRKETPRQLSTLDNNIERFAELQSAREGGWEKTN